MVPEVYVRGTATTLRIAAAGILLALVPAVAAPAAERSLTLVVYDYAVTSYCGVLTPAVEAGFQKELAVLTARGGIDPETARRLRIRGWVLADEEWRNRGLGGQRAWCREEGQAAARHFRAIADGSQQP